MKNQRIKQMVSIILITMILGTFIQPYKLQAIGTQPISFLEDETAIYENVKGDLINYNGFYYTVAPITFNDGTYNSAVFISEDGNKWTILSQLFERSRELPVSKSMRILNNQFIVSVTDHEGDVLYLSKEGKTWEFVDLHFKDITSSSGKYWAIDSKGVIYYSDDLMNWNRLTQLTSSTTHLNILAICVTDNVIVVSHYNPLWGSNNYKNGLEVYDRKQGVWKETKGYDGHIGITKDIVWTGKNFILVYQNDHKLNATDVFYTSSDGFTWKVEDNKTALIRDLYVVKDMDTNYSKLIKILKDLIDANAINGGITPVLVQLDGKTIVFDQDAVLVKGAVLVPVRKLFEVLGGTITWSAATKQVTGVVGENSIQLTIGSTTAYFNNKQVLLDVPARVINDSTLVPVRFIADSLGKEVVWDKVQYIVKISSVK